MPVQSPTCTRGYRLVPQAMAVYERELFSDGVHDNESVGLGWQVYDL